MTTPGPEPDPTIDVPKEASTGDVAPGLGAVAGDAVGPFKIIRILGEGGFGVVYLAEQTSPMKRRVALKVIKPGMDTKSVIARFEAERQALAMMDFAGIAKVFEAGATPQGRPYFVMEYVKGEPINTYCDRHTLDTRARLNLFAKVCDAIQHAHQKGVIHRDLKPGNILVTIDARDEPQPKVIDFGIAKATAQPLTEKTLFTEQGQLIGTPEYMSPEQAEMSAVDVDTRSDVYSLGVILYELLSGHLPFDPKTLRSKGFAEIQRIIREEDPPKPSTKLTTTESEEGTRIADARKTKLAELQSTLRKELEWIPLKALRKERTERYSSAEDLADDVRRYLVGEPLEAGPESASYRFKKLVRRNKGPFIAAALIALALIGGIIGTTIFAVRAAEQARIAEQRSEELQQVADFQSQQLSGIDVQAMGWSLRGKMLEELELEPSDVVGADFTGAALKLLNEHVFEGTHTTINEHFAELPLVRAQLLQSLAIILRELGLLEEATEPQQTALHLRREHMPPDNPSVLTSKAALGRLLWLKGDPRAEEYLVAALEGRRRVLTNEHPDTISSIGSVGGWFVAHGRYEEGLPYYEESLQLSRDVLGPSHKSTLASINNMGVWYWQQGKAKQAIPYFEEAVKNTRNAFGENNATLCTYLMNLGAAHYRLGDGAEAERLYLESLRCSLATKGELHQNTIEAQLSLGGFHYGRKEFVAAEPYLLSALDSSRIVNGPSHHMTIMATANIVSLATAVGDTERALRHLSDLLESSEQLPESHPQRLQALLAAVKVYRAQAEYAEAEPYALEAVQIARRTKRPGHPLIGMTANAMGSVLEKQERYTDATPYFAESLEIDRNARPEGDHRTVMGMDNLGYVLYEQEKFSEAERYFIEALETTRRFRGDNDQYVLHLLNRLIKLHDAWHEADPDASRDANAAEYRALLEELSQSDE